MKRNKAIYSMIMMMIVGLLSGSLFGQTPKLTDPEIAFVTVTANQIDLNYAKIAKMKSKNNDVLKFAETMANDHQSVIDQATALVKKSGVTPMDNALSKKLNADAEKTKKMLSLKSGDEFNKAYIDNEVSYHKAVIDIVENTLIPQAQIVDLTALLENLVPVLKTHLEHAEILQKMFAK